MSISVVVPVYNGASTLRQSLDSPCGIGKDKDAVYRVRNVFKDELLPHPPQNDDLPCVPEHGVDPPTDKGRNRRPEFLVLSAVKMDDVGRAGSTCDGS